MDFDPFYHEWVVDLHIVEGGVLVFEVVRGIFQSLDLLKVDLLFFLTQLVGFV